MSGLGVLAVCGLFGLGVCGVPCLGGVWVFGVGVTFFGFLFYYLTLLIWVVVVGFGFVGGLGFGFVGGLSLCLGLELCGGVGFVRWCGCLFCG